MGFIEQQIWKFLDDYKNNQELGGVPWNTFLSVYDKYFPYSQGWNSEAKRKMVCEKLYDMEAQGKIKIVDSPIGKLIKV